MKLSKFIKTMQQIHKQLKAEDLKADPQILISSDEEGNSFGTIVDGSFFFEKNKPVILFSWERKDAEEMEELL